MVRCVLLDQAGHQTNDKIVCSPGPVRDKAINVGSNNTGISRVGEIILTKSRGSISASSIYYPHAMSMSFLHVMPSCPSQPPRRNSNAQRPSAFLHHRSNNSGKIDNLWFRPGRIRARKKKQGSSHVKPVSSSRCKASSARSSPPWRLVSSHTPAIFNPVSRRSVS